MPADYAGVTGPAFRFRLERVRALRERSEDLAKQELATALAQQNSCEDDLKAAEERLSQARQTQRDTAAVALSATELIANQAYIERAERDREATAHDLDRRVEEVDVRRTVLSRASRDREALERLKERRRNDHQGEVARGEGRAQDELALNRFLRRGA